MAAFFLNKEHCYDAENLVSVAKKSSIPLHSSANWNCEDISHGILAGLCWAFGALPKGP